MTTCSSFRSAVAAILAVVAIPASIVRAEQTTNENDKHVPGLAKRYPRYQVRAADVIDVVFSPASEFNQTIGVQPDGYVSLREVGDLYVLGKTLPELEKMLADAYGKILHDPKISLTLKDYEKPRYTVGGQVGRPGKYDLRADTTVGEAVAIAGGLTDKAKQKQVVLFRRVSDEWVEVKQFDIKALYSGKIQEDIHLRAGDMVFVPQSRMSKLKPFLPIWTVGTYLGLNPTF
jgi:polysaccharide export outer membrane protein